MDRAVRYAKRVGVAVSVTINVALGGKSNQTFSARNYEWKRNGRPNGVWMIDVLFFFDGDHCLRSWTYWVVRKDIE